MGRAMYGRRRASHLTADDTVTRGDAGGRGAAGDPRQWSANHCHHANAGLGYRTGQGFLLTEGVIARRDDVLTVRYCRGASEDGANSFNVLDVTLAEDVPMPDVDVARTSRTTSSGCAERRRWKPCD